MTRKEELAYLVGIINEASKWSLSEGDTRDTIRLEIEHRVSVLLGESTDTPAEDGRVHDTPREKPRHIRSRNTHVGKVHVTIGGKQKWIDRNLVTQVPCKHSKSGYKWVLKEVDDGTEKT